jgi:acetate---CoA ligase (ADP-forming)
MVLETNDRRSAAASRFATLTPLIVPRSVAVLGASNDPVRIGGRPLAYMKAQNFRGEIFPVNPNRAEVQGLRAFASLADLPKTPDVAIVAVPGSLAVQAVEELGALGVRGAIVFTAGFAELGNAGTDAQARMVAASRAYGMRLLGPNCLGLFNGAIGYYATFSSSLDTGWPIPGRIGIASQSGAYGTHLFTVARNRRIGVSLCVTTGNEGDVTVGDVIGWMAEHDETDVIAVYAEGIREADTLLSALAIARSARKPVIMMKVGRSKLGREAALSHTASIAGDDAVLDTVLAEFGVVRARTTEQMLDIAHTASRGIYPARNTLGVLTVSGGAGVLISDAAESLGVAMPEMPEATQERLKTLVSFSSSRNPVDCTAQVSNDMTLVGAFLEAMVNEGGYSSVLAFFTQVGGSRRAPELRAQLKGVRDRYPDRLYVLSVIASPEQVSQYEADGYVCHEDPSRAVAAIEAMGQFGAAFGAPEPAPPPEVAPVGLPATSPSEAEAKRLLAAAGIPSVAERVCTSAEQAVEAAEAFRYPVVMKIVSPDILHKSDIGGVLLDVSDPGAVSAGYAKLLERACLAAPGARIEGVLVAKQIKGGLECILGIHRDPVFGPIAMFGLGGIFVEIQKDVAFHRCPFGEDVAERMIHSIRGVSLLTGARGRPPTDVKALALMLARLSVFAHQAGPRLRSLDLNPVLALPEGEGAFAADAVIEVADQA